MAKVNLKNLQKGLMTEVFPGVLGGISAKAINKVAPAMQAKVPSKIRNLIKIGIGTSIPMFTKTKGAKEFGIGFAAVAASELFTELMPSMAGVDTEVINGVGVLEEEIELERINGQYPEEMNGTENNGNERNAQL